MTKKYYLLSCLILLSLVSFSQHSRIPLNEAPMRLAPLSEEGLKYSLTHTKVNKALGDTLFYEDFSGGFSTNGWTSVDTTQNGFDWIYTTAAPGGQYSTTMPALNSVTAANGFASLPSDFYNTPTPAGGLINMNASLTSGPIAINPVGNVLLRWRQSLRYCCNPSTERLELQVSTDSINWVAFDAKFGRSPSAFIANEDVEINISTVASNEDTIYLRFFQTASHYLWMIDDIAIIEGFDNQLSIIQSNTVFGSGLDEGFYTQIPTSQFQSMSFSTDILNEGSFDATNVKLFTKIVHSPAGIVFSDSSQNIDTIKAPLGVATAKSVQSFTSAPLGQHTISFVVLADSAHTTPSLARHQFEWIKSDTVFAKDYNRVGGVIGPSSYVGGDNDGSRIGTNYTIVNSARLSSISFYVSSSTSNVGVSVNAQIWGFDTSQATLNDMLNVPGVKFQSPTPYTITSSDLGSWVHLPLGINGSTVNISPGQYVAAIEQVSGNANQLSLSLGRDISVESFQPYGQQFVSLVYANDAAPAWGNIFAQPMIRLNFSSPVVGLNETAKEIEGFTVSPNPNNGQFNVEITATRAKFDLTVRNVVGQVVYNEAITVNNVLRKNIDLSKLNKGIYFVSIENGVNRKVQKVIIK